ncbi:MAG: HupE/UreJ family protein [Bacteroidota bacterium]
MSSVFSTYLQLGFDHISDITAYDHILFIVALCAIYRLREWRKVLILVTAFTVGHSITLALAVLDIIQFPGDVIEFLIPLTILITSIYNVTRNESLDQPSGQTFTRSLNINYGFALFFGLIHGMGFSNFLKSTLMPGQESELVTQLLAFNIGIELGQLLIVCCILVASFIALNPLNIHQRDWRLFISGATAGISLILMLEVGVPW